MDINRNGDMTQGNIVSILTKLTVPMLVGSLVQQFYNVTDLMFVGRLVGAGALGAVGVTGTLFGLIFALCNGTATGLGIIVAQYYGKKEKDEVKRTILNAYFVLFILGAAIHGGGMYCAKYLLRILDTPESIFREAVIYFRIICMGSIAVSFYNGLATIFRSLGDSRTPLLFLALSSAVNIVLDYLFLAVFSMGIAGAARATILAQWAAAVGCIVYAVKTREEFRVDIRKMEINWRRVRTLLYTGIPLALQGVLISVSVLFLQRIVNSFGEAAASAFAVTSRIDMLSQQPYVCLGMAMAAFTGQNMGAGNIARIHQAYRKCVLLALGWSAAILLAVFVGREFLVRMFVDDVTVIELGKKAVCLTALFYFPLGMIHISRGALNGVGDIAYSLINGCIELAGRVCLGWILVTVPAVGMWSPWYATGITWLVTGFAGAMRYEKGKWQKNRFLQ